MIRSAHAEPRRLARVGAIILILIVQQLAVAETEGKNKSSSRRIAYVSPSDG